MRTMHLTDCAWSLKLRTLLNCTAGMIDSNEGGPFLLEADQGDVITGSISRDEYADALVAALSAPEVCSSES